MSRVAGVVVAIVLAGVAGIAIIAGALAVGYSELTTNTLVLGGYGLLAVAIGAAVAAIVGKSPRLLFLVYAAVFVALVIVVVVDAIV